MLFLQSLINHHFKAKQENELNISASIIAPRNINNIS